MASATQSVGKVSFSNWKYAHYFEFIEVTGKNVHVKCKLCAGGKTLSTSAVSNSNLMKHLTSVHASTRLVAKNTDTPASTDSTSTSKDEQGLPKSKQQRFDISPRQTKPLTQSEVNRLIGRYIVSNMLPLSTVDDEAFRDIIDKIPKNTDVSAPCICILMEILVAQNVCKTS